MDKYKQYSHLITASNYITPFNVVSKRDVKLAFHTAGEVNIFSKTPSLGGIWSTHPSLKYASNQNDLFGEKAVFSKVSTENNVKIERENLIKMRKHVSVPKALGFYRNEEDDLSELQELKPGCQIAAVLVEEFIHSISLGQAIIEEKIDVDRIVRGVLETLKNMHKFCVHLDLKHSHIRINLDPKTCESLASGVREQLSLEIEGVSIIDVETTKMGEELADKEFKDDVKRDIAQLLTSLAGYMSTLEPDTEVIRKFFPTPLNKRLERFGMFLDAIKGEYTVDLPRNLLTTSKTAKFLLETLGS